MKIILPCGDHYQLIDSISISHIEACQNYTKVYLLDSTMVLCNMSMVAMVEKLDSTFMQIHKSYTVNLAKVTKYYKKGTVQLVNGVSVPIARRRHKELMTKWQNIYDDEN